MKHFMKCIFIDLKEIKIQDWNHIDSEATNKKMTYYNCWLKSQFRKLKHKRKPTKKYECAIEEEKKSFKRPNNKWFH